MTIHSSGFLAALTASLLITLSRCQNNVVTNVQLSVSLNCNEYTVGVKQVLTRTMANVCSVNVNQVSLKAPACESQGITFKPTSHPITSSPVPATTMPQTTTTVAGTTTTATTTTAATTTTTAPTTTTTQPSSPPTRIPSQNPSTTSPSKYTSQNPSANPSVLPSFGPTMSPTMSPSPRPTNIPTTVPSATPTVKPTKSPLGINVTHVPTIAPSAAPTVSPSTSAPSKTPSTTQPSIGPTTTRPTSAPSTTSPSMQGVPSSSPTNVPTLTPTNVPTDVPTLSPTAVPTDTPTLVPTTAPTQNTTARRRLRRLQQNSLNLDYTIRSDQASATRIEGLVRQNNFQNDFKRELGTQIAVYNNQTNGTNSTSPLPPITVNNIQLQIPPKKDECVSRNLPSFIVLPAGVGGMFILAGIVLIIFYCECCRECCMCCKGDKSYRPKRTKQEKAHQNELELAIAKRQESKPNQVRARPQSTVDPFAEGDFRTGTETSFPAPADRGRGKSEVSSYYDL